MHNNNVNKEKLDIIREWIINGPNINGIEKAKKIGEIVAKNGLTTSQIRNIFNSIKKIEYKEVDDIKPALLMLKPLTAYSLARIRNDDSKKAMSILKEDIIDPSINIIFEIDNNKKENNIKDEKIKRFKNFVLLFEAILSYHKYYGGKR